MLLQIIARPDARLIADAVRRGLRPVLFTVRGVGWAAISLALLLEVVTGGGPNVTLLLAGALLAVGVPMVLVNSGTRQALRGGDLATYEISDGGLARSSAASRHAWAWTAFSYVEEMSGQLLFGSRRTGILPVPTATLTPAQIDQVLGAAAGHGLRIRRA